MLQVSLLSLFAPHESWSKTELPEDMKHIDYWPLTVQEVADRLATGKTIFIPGYISSWGDYCFQRRLCKELNFKYFMPVIILIKCNKNVSIQHLFPHFWSYLREMLYQLAKRFWDYHLPSFSTVNIWTVSTTSPFVLCVNPDNGFFHTSKQCTTQFI